VKTRRRVTQNDRFDGDILMKTDPQRTVAGLDTPILERAARSSAELMSDSAVYRRTQRGQRELLRAPDASATAALRLLARFNGYTDLRRLVDLAPADAREMARGIEQLFNDGLIELVDVST
jgi:hypothetical protein